MNTIQTQQDTQTRMVALTNLEAMCERVSGVMCHKFSVSKVSRSRVHVEYSNEDEYACARPMTAVFPCFPSDWPGDEDNPRVLLLIMRVINDTWDGEGWQAFQPLLDCPVLWRGLDGKTWQTREEIETDGCRGELLTLRDINGNRVGELRIES